ncbi:MAG TPA: alpha-L-fucosidase [Sumerlaeia bacterium]|nr:alpha-L-fucosidase [Sumerlaeia bacterium]
MTPKTPRLAKPTPQQAAWQDLEVGMFIHFGPWTWQDLVEGGGPVPLSIMKPDQLDTDQWVSVAEAMSAKYIVFVAKHGDGFCWWRTDTPNDSVKDIPWRDGKGDVMRDLSESCRRRGMKLGVYLSPADRQHGAAVGGKCKSDEEQEAYIKVYRQQLTELLSRYGEMMEVWFDGSLVFEVGDIIAKYAPKAMVFQGPHATIRWVGNEDGYAPYPGWNAVNVAKDPARYGVYTAEDGDPDGDTWLPNECDARIRADWMWTSRNADTLKSVEDLMEMYCGSVGRGGALLLNNTPDPTGLIPEADARRSAEFGAEIQRRFSKNLAETAGAGDIVELTLAGPTRIDRVVTMEDIREGERVREYVIEGMTDGAWREIAKGTAIGHKKIDRFEAVEVSKVRLRVVKCAAEPLIRKLAVYGAASAVGAETKGRETAAAGFQKAREWTPEDVGVKWSNLDVDLVPWCKNATQYEVVFKQTGGANDLEVRSATLLFEGVEAAHFVSKGKAAQTFLVTITGIGREMVFRASVRGKGGTDTRGEVLIRERKIE